jgi:hypothetical protein
MISLEMKPNENLFSIHPSSIPTSWCAIDCSFTLAQELQRLWDIVWRQLFWRKVMFSVKNED